MGKPTVTLAAIRRTLCRDMKMPFSRRYGNGYLVADSGSDTTLVDATLTQAENFWVGSWIYNVTSQEAAWIVRFDSNANKLTFETPITAISTDNYEIHTGWNAYELHEAINRAIRDAQRYFPNEVTDETLIIQEDVRNYSLSSLASVPWLIHRVWLEQPTSVKRGTVVSATGTTVVVESSGILTGVTTNYKVSIYKGTGKGQIRSVVSTSGAEIAVEAWTTNPDSTSKYALWDGSDQTYRWYPFDALHTDAKEFPTTLYFDMRPVDFYGLRMRIEYSALPNELTTEASTTIVPEVYLEMRARAYLHEMRIGDTQADRDLHFGEWKRFKDQSDEYLLRSAPHMKDTIRWTNPDHLYQPDTNNPLGWGE